MIITCEECQTSYNLSASQLQPSGTKVRCTNCRHVFTAYPPPEESPETIKAEPVAEPQLDTPLSQAADEVNMRDTEDLFDSEAQDSFAADSAMDADDSDEFDLAGEDFDLPGNDMDLADGGAPTAEDLELTDEDLDLVMDMAPPGGTAAPADTPDAVMPDEAASAVAAIDDFDDLLEDIPTEPDRETEAAVEPEDDLDLDIDFGEDTESASDAPQASPSAPDLEGTDELDLDLDLDLDLGEDEPAAVAEETVEETSLSLDDDFQLENVVDENDATAEIPDAEEDLTVEPFAEAAAPETDADEAPSAVDDLAFEDLDLELDLDGETDSAEETAPTDSGEPELALEMDTEGDDAIEDSLDLDLDFELEEDAGDTPALEGDAQEADPAMTLDVDEEENAGLDLAADDDLALEDDDLALELDGLDLSDDDGAIEVDAPEEELALDLGGDLDLAMDETAAPSGDGEDDLDLSDLEGILDEDEKDADPVLAAGNDATAEDESLFGDDDLGLGSELESILDEADEEVEDSFSLDEEPELDLDLESAQTASADDDGLDLSDFEYLAEDGETAPSDDHFDSGDMELEFQVDEEGTSALEEADAAFTPPPTLADTEAELAAPEIVPEVAPAAKAPAGPTPAPKKRGTSKLLIAVLIVVLLLGGGYCAYILLDGMGIRIPYVSDYLKPEANDPGNLQLTTFDINSRFVDSQVMGRVFVITGKVKNGYDHPRGFVQLTGKLFTKGKVLSSSQTVYAGNLISDMDLVNLTPEELQKRLNNRFGNNRINSRLQPGKSLPFMVVFSQLPEAQLEEFTIEVDTSTALK